MQNLPIYQVDAFSEDIFGGNPAAVVPVPEFPREELMQRIAAENNLSETAFVVIEGQGKFAIRWFTPTQEVRLCGHATLASAHVLYTSSDGLLEKLSFKTQKAGTITVTPNEDNSYSMDFAADIPVKIRPPKGLTAALGGIKAKEVWKGTDDLIVLLKDQKQVEELQPDFSLLGKMKDYRGLLATAPGEQHDFVSRGFFPYYGINEDPVTGSAHTVLTPFWGPRLKKRKMTARQVSQRGGNLLCEIRGKKVRLTGHAVTYLVGQLILE
jgi:PhzF family phenazine biosynthesis protein